jgi:hypothetical protein
MGTLKRARAPSTLRLTPHKPLVSTGGETDETDSGCGSVRGCSSIWWHSCIGQTYKRFHARSSSGTGS